MLQLNSLQKEKKIRNPTLDLQEAAFCVTSSAHEIEERDKEKQKN